MHETINVSVHQMEVSHAVQLEELSKDKNMDSLPKESQLRHGFPSEVCGQYQPQAR